METKPEGQSPSALTPDLADSFVKVTKAVSELTKSAHEVAQEGPTVSMLTYGPVMILIAVVLKVFPQVNLDIAEFSVLVASGTLLFIASAAMRLYQWKVQTEIDSEIRQQAFQTLQAQQSAAISNATVGGGKTVQT
jgi:uncharacterized protein (DUF2062 family)